MTGEFLYVSDSASNIHKFMIRENLSFLNEINLLTLYRDIHFNRYIKSIHNNNTYHTDDDPSHRTSDHAS